MTRAPSRSRRPVRPQARRVRHARLVLACLLAAAGGLAQAGDCRVSATSINFGSYDPVTGTGPVDSTGGVRVDCRATYWLEDIFGVYVDIALGQGSSGTYAARTLRQGPSILQYNLYTDASRTTVWGNGAGGTQIAGGTVGGWWTGQPWQRSFPVFGRIPPGQDPNIGPHGDTITVVVTF
ncbi:spore coat U domain-containing protein [uncultured Luteimonas sp.]|uniref:Csu type fimbrial protein n=1 Tax=uncultured Luteimonas sp. TaxID=453144 RepID=UPI0026137366|nr:spore coat U domain-containing protein [uncultured Luteimonas sp.]